MIALITDFGLSDHYAGVIKGVIKGINPDADIVDITHEVRAHSILDAQFILLSSFRYFPPGTIFCIIVDPGVGTARRALIAVDDHKTYVLPDNGIITPIATAGMRYYTIDMSSFTDISSTFHGRDIFAPVTARLSLGTPADDIGHSFASIVERPFPAYSISDNGIRCTIVHIDRFGNATTSLPLDAFDFIPGEIRSVINPSYSFRAACSDSYAGIAKGGEGIIRGSSGFLELAAHAGSVSEKFGINIEDPIVLSKSAYRLNGHA